MPWGFSGLDIASCPMLEAARLTHFGKYNKGKFASNNIIYLFFQ
jgi:hypothetical protein